MAIHEGKRYREKVDAIAGLIRKLTGLDWANAVDLVQNMMLKFMGRVTRDQGDMDFQLTQLITNGLDEKYKPIWWGYFWKVVKEAKEKRARRREVQWVNGSENNVLDREVDEFTQQEDRILNAVFNGFPDGDEKVLFGLLLCERTEEFTEKTGAKRSYLTKKLVKILFGWKFDTYEKKRGELFHSIAVEMDRRIALEEWTVGTTAGRHVSDADSGNDNGIVAINSELKGTSNNEQKPHEK